MVKLPACDGKGFSGNSFQDGLQGQSARDWECVARLKKHGADNQYMICMIYIYICIMIYYVNCTVLNLLNYLTKKSSKMRASRSSESWRLVGESAAPLCGDHWYVSMCPWFLKPSNVWKPMMIKHPPRMAVMEFLPNPSPASSN